MRREGDSRSSLQGEMICYECDYKGDCTSLRAYTIVHCSAMNDEHLFHIVSDNLHSSTDASYSGFLVAILSTNVHSFVAKV